MAAAPGFPTVALDAPALVHQGADLVARATFSLPNLPPDTPLNPTDTRFTVRKPSGAQVVYRGGNPAVRAGASGWQLAVRADAWGDWHVRVDATLVSGGQRVTVSDERLVHVAPSAIR